MAGTRTGIQEGWLWPFGDVLAREDFQRKPDWRPTGAIFITVIDIKCASIGFIHDPGPQGMCRHLLTVLTATTIHRNLLCM